MLKQFAPSFSYTLNPDKSEKSEFSLQIVVPKIGILVVSARKTIVLRQDMPSIMSSIVGGLRAGLGIAPLTTSAVKSLQKVLFLAETKTCALQCQASLKLTPSTQPIVKLATGLFKASNIENIYAGLRRGAFSNCVLIVENPDKILEQLKSVWVTLKEGAFDPERFSIATFAENGNLQAILPTWADHPEPLLEMVTVEPIDDPDPSPD